MQLRTIGAGYQVDAHRQGGSAIPTRRAVCSPTRDDLRVSHAPGVEFRPAHLTRRQTADWGGLAGEVVQILDYAPFETEYAGPRHLLIAYERAIRGQGESVLEGLSLSRQHDFSRKLTFIPAGRRFFESQQPRVPTQAIYVYIDPRSFSPANDEGFDTVEPQPRLFFDSPLLWQIIGKFKQLIELGSGGYQHYAEALGVVLTHELLQFSKGTALSEPVSRGGLATWQRRLVAQYVEENLAEHVSVATLAGLVRLSPYHFSRAFKQSFGMPPHGYHMNLRIERAKTLLAKRSASVTEIAFQVGFSEASAFTAAFRRRAGRTPTEYRRSLF